MSEFPNPFGIDWSEKARSIPDTEDTEFPRATLIDICRRAIVPESKWLNRDSASAQKDAAVCGALLAAGCRYRVLREAGRNGLATDAKTIWIKIEYEGFMWHEVSQISSDVFYLPTEASLAEADGNDWY